jgi:hypothetical protein
MLSKRNIIIAIAVLAAVIIVVGVILLLPEREKQIPVSSIPAVVLEAMNQKTSGGEITSAEMGDENGKPYYEIVKTVEGKEYEFDIFPDGTIMPPEQGEEGQKEAGEVGKVKEEAGEKGEAAETGEVAEQGGEAETKEAGETVSESQGWTEDFNLDTRTLASTGKNLFFILEPGYQLTLEGKEGTTAVVLIVTVLNETKKVGTVETRVVEERETENGVVSEVSRNFFAIDTKTNDVFYFGEDVDVYKNGKIDNHEGSWSADAKDCKAGMYIPGTILIGARYYQEMAPKIAMDRAEIISTKESLKTTAGTFNNCLKVQESSAIESGKEYKLFAPGIGLIKDEDLTLTKYGYIKK